MVTVNTQLMGIENWRPALVVAKSWRFFIFSNTPIIFQLKTRPTDLSQVDTLSLRSIQHSAVIGLKTSPRSGK